MGQLATHDPLDRRRALPADGRQPVLRHRMHRRGCRPWCRRRWPMPCSAGRRSLHAGGTPRPRRRRHRTGAHRALAARRARSAAAVAVSTQCVEAGMLVVAGDGVAFRHELARAVILGPSPAQPPTPSPAALAALERAEPAATSPDWPSTPRRPETRPPCCVTARGRDGGDCPWAPTGQRPPTLTTRSGSLDQLAGGRARSPAGLLAARALRARRRSRNRPRATERRSKDLAPLPMRERKASCSSAWPAR